MKRSLFATRPNTVSRWRSARTPALESILLADIRSHEGLTSYGDEYYDRFYAKAGAVLVRQLSDASTDIGSYWMTAWINAGRPQLPSR